MIYKETMANIKTILRWVSHGVVVSALRCGWENSSSSPPWTLNLMTNAVAICQIIITQPFPEML